MSLSKVNLSGTVISDVEMRHTPNGHGVANFTIETANLNARQPGMFQVKITCWRGLAEGVPSQIAKGDTVLVEGKLMVNQEQESPPAGGMQRRYYEIEATNVYKAGGPIQEVQPVMTQQAPQQQAQPQQQQAQPQMQQAPQQQAPQPQQAPQQQAVPAGGFSSDDLLTEDDIPF